MSAAVVTLVAVDGVDAAAVAGDWPALRRAFVHPGAVSSDHVASSWLPRLHRWVDLPPSELAFDGQPSPVPVSALTVGLLCLDTSVQLLIRVAVEGAHADFVPSPRRRSPRCSSPTPSIPATDARCRRSRSGSWVATTAGCSPSRRIAAGATSAMPTSRRPLRPRWPRRPLRLGCAFSTPRRGGTSGARSSSPTSRWSTVSAPSTSVGRFVVDALAAPSSEHPPTPLSVVGHGLRHLALLARDPGVAGSLGDDVPARAA